MSNITGDALTDSRGRFRISKVLPKSWVSKRYENRLRASVRKGSKTLDRLIPTWYSDKIIKLSQLDLRSSCNCVFGQVENALRTESAKVDLSGLIKVGVINGYLDHGQEVDGNDAAYVLSYFEDDDYGYTYAGIEEYGTPRDKARLDASWSSESDETLEIGNVAFAILQDEWEKQITKRREEAKFGAKKVLV